MVMDGLGEVLRQQNDPDYKDEAKEEALRLASEMRVKSIIDRKGKENITLSDLL
jgi:hypothetical protein